MPRRFTTMRSFAAHYEFATMFAASADLVTLHDLDGTIRLASQSSRAVLGLAPDELIGRMPAETFLRTEDVPQLAAALDRLRKGADTVELTLGARTRTGQPQWLETRLGAVRGLDGSATGFLAISRVVTDRLETERRLQTQLERYRQITNAVPGMTAWIIDRDLRCRFAAGDRLRPIAATPDRPVAACASGNCASGIPTNSTACCAALAITNACGSAMPTSSQARMNMRRKMKRGSSPA